MKSVRFLGHGKCVVENIPDPTPDDRSVIVKVKASGLCGSELHGFRGDPSLLGSQRNGGHEVAGEVVWAPKGSAYAVGQRVGARVVQGCGACGWCKQGDETACENKTYYSQDGHAELFKLGLAGVHVLPDDVEWPAAVILSGDGLGVPTRCARRLGNTAGKKVVVLGLGPVGLACAMVQAFRGARVLGVDVSEYRMNLAREFGAERTVAGTGNKGVIDEVLQWTDGFGADVVILAVARQESLQLAFELVRRHGTVFQVAEFGEATMHFSNAFIRKEASMTGSWYYTSSDWPLMLQLHRDGLPYKKLVTHVMALDQAQEAFDTFIGGKSGKVILRTAN